MECGWTQVSLDGVRVGEAQELRQEGEVRQTVGVRRKARPQRYGGCRVTRTWRGIGHVRWAGEGKQAGGKGGPQVSGQHGLEW